MSYTDHFIITEAKRKAEIFEGEVKKAQLLAQAPKGKRWYARLTRWLRQRAGRPRGPPRESKQKPEERSRRPHFSYSWGSERANEMIGDKRISAVSNGERIIQSGGVRLCFETFGNALDPALLLIHGPGTSMLGWEAELCEQLAAEGRFVIRYDRRDTGLSETYPPGQPGYALSDMTQDALAILDALDIESAHIVGRSMAGAIVLGIGVDYPHRAKTLTFVTTTPVMTTCLFRMTWSGTPLKLRTSTIPER